ncbi:MAG TPA: PH domain-containing protein [Alphaproteobacteria bacterium]|nr:PH domain-containing protein [Alphaproteobacteria bacterium]
MSAVHRKIHDHKDIVPKYRVRPHPERLLLDRVIALAVLGILLYIGIYINYYIVSATIPPLLNWLIITGIILLLTLEAILRYVQYNNYSYDFYEHKLVVNNGKMREIKYSDITDISYNHSSLDRLMHTGSIVITLKNSHKVNISHLKNSNQAFLYLQKHIKQ